MNARRRLLQMPPLKRADCSATHTHRVVATKLCSSNVPIVISLLLYDMQDALLISLRELARDLLLLST